MSQGYALKPKDRHFAMHSERAEGGAQIRVEGEMDLSVIGLVDREVERAEATEATTIVLDLHSLEFMDASGVRLLLDLNARSESNGRRLRIAGPRSRQVQRVLELTGVGDQLPFED